MDTTCRHCGDWLDWTAEDLRYHLERLDRGEHAACACDDDCAAECAPWEREELVAAIALEVRAERDWIAE